MFTRLFGSSDTKNTDADRQSLRERYTSWRFRGDIAAITATLDRLSDRRLDMIGMRREDLFWAVSDMMMRAEEERQIGREVIALLEAPKAANPAPAPRTVTPAGPAKDAGLAAAAA
jgi:hypothetical protein